MKLLVADDSAVMRKVIRAAVEMLDMEMLEAQDGVEAFEKLTEFYEEIGLILLDWNMPEENGYDVLVKIKGDEKYKDIPVMMVTTEGQQSNIIAAVRAGANNYLVKPFSVEDLNVKILECIGQGG
ncbi:MAG: response regulator [Oscillospiraceae bacterium]|nr:response regulator [Oscillospiraceae bacterium]